MHESDERGPWYLITGLILGILLGLGYAWSVQPVRYTDTNPATLRQDFKDQYRALIAAAFLGNGDVVRARARLELLHDDDMYRALTEQAQRSLAENGSDNQARALGMLAIALGQSPPGPGGAVTQAERAPTAGPTQPLPTAPSFDTPTPAETAALEAPETEQPVETQPSLTEAPAATEQPDTPAAETPAVDQPTESSAPQPTAPVVPPKATAIPSTAPSSTPGGPFILLSQEKICDKTFAAPLFQIEALDRFNQPLAGALVIVSWPGGEDTFYTGLKPEMGPGYADFKPTQGVLYTIKVGENGAPARDLAAVMCSQGGNTPQWGALLLKFIQP